MRTIKKVSVAVGVAVLIFLATLLVWDIYRTARNSEPSVPFTLLNDTNGAVEVGACAGGGPKPPIEPGQSDTYYAYPSDPNAACGFFDTKTDRYLGCLPTPVTQSKNDTFRVSNADPAIDSNNCGLARTR